MSVALVSSHMCIFFCYNLCSTSWHPLMFFLYYIIFILWRQGHNPTCLRSGQVSAVCSCRSSGLVARTLLTETFFNLMLSSVKENTTEALANVDVSFQGKLNPFLGWKMGAKLTFKRLNLLSGHSP